MKKQFAIVAAVVVALVAGPASAASADQPVGTCTVGIVLPSRLALTGATTSYGVRLTGQTSCFSYAPWDLSQGLISTGQVLQFWAPTTSGFFTYAGGPNIVHALPRQGGYSFVKYTDPTIGVAQTYTLAQSGSNTMTVKYDSRIAWRSGKRTGRQLTLRAAVASLSDSTRYTGSYAAWAMAKVRFQHLKAGVWQTVAVGRADPAGITHAVVPYAAGQWRAVSADSATTWGRTTGTHKL